MKKVLSLFLSVLMLTSIVAAVDLSAYSATSGNYTYTVSNGSATITGYSGSDSTLTIPSTLGGYTVTTIGDGAFESCNGLTSVTIPDSVTTIEDGAFYGCLNLTSVTIGCGVQSIGAEAFQNTALTKATYSGTKCQWDNNVYNNIQRGNSDLTTLIEKEKITYSKGDHSYKSKTTAATCTEKGYTTYTCEFCGDSYKSNSTNATDHTWNSGTTTKKATCAATGTKTYTCKNCGATTTETIAKTSSHTYDSGKTTTQATCAKKGVKTYTCTVCGKTKTEDIPKLTTHTWDSGKVTKAATCKSNGTKTYTCSVCKTTKTETIDKSTAHTWNKGTTTKKATCTATGSKKYTCTTCGATKTDKISAKGHTYKVSTKASAKNKKNGKLKCSVCGATKTMYYPKTVKLSSSSYTYNKKAKKPTVTVKDSKGNKISSKYYSVTYINRETGKTVSSMKNYGKYYVKVTFKTRYSGSLKQAVTIKATTNKKYACSSHKYKVTTKATKDKNGKFTCSVCGWTKTIYKFKTMSLSTNKYTYDGKAKKPTVTVKDSKGNKISSKYYTVSYINQSTGKKVSSMKSAGKYYVKVTFKSRYKGSLKKAVTIKPPATSIKKLTAIEKGFTAQWTKKTNSVSGYQVQYATNKNFTGAKSRTIKSNGTASRTISGLSANTKYYVRVRTYKTVKINGESEKIYSSWSSVKGVTTKAAASTNKSTTTTTTTTTKPSTTTTTNSTTSTSPYQPA